jgi:WD40 repeat protein
MAKELNTSTRRNRLILNFLPLVALLAAGTLAASSMSSASPGADAVVPPELVLQTGHASRVNCAVFSPDGRWLASGSADKTIKIWDVANGRELRTLTGHANWITSLAVSHDGKWLASGSNDRSVRVWDVLTGRELFNFTGHAASIAALAFSPDNRWLASGSGDSSIKIWDLSTGKEAQTLKRHAGGVSSLAFSDDGRLLASGSADNTIKLWETGGWQEVRTLKKHTGKVTAVAFSADSNWLASASADGMVCLWQTGSDRERFTMKHSSASVLAIAFGPGGSLISAQGDGAIVIWDSATGKEKRAIPAGPDSEELVFAAFSPDRNVLVSSIGDRNVDLRSVESGKVDRVLESHSTTFKAVAFSGDGRWLASGAEDGLVRLWQVATGRELPTLSGHTAFVTTIAFSQDSHFLASGSSSGEVKVWDMETEREAFSLPRVAEGIDVVAFSPDGKSLAAAGMQPTIQVWNLQTKQARALAGHTDEVTTVAFSPTEPLLASGGRDKTIRLWNLDTGAIVKTFDNLNAEVNSVTFSPDGKWLASADSAGTVTLREMAKMGSGSGRQLDLSGQGGEVLKVTFSSKGQLLASAGADRVVKLWDPKTGREVRTLTGPSETVNGVSFSNDGQWVLAGSDDGSMMIWSAASGDLAATLVSTRDRNDWLVVTPDGLFDGSPALDGSPAAWDLILWRFAGNTYKVSTVETFFTEYYYPGVLSDLLAGKNPKAKQDISQKDRRQPLVSLAVAGGENGTGTVSQRKIAIKIEVSEAVPDEEHANGSGAQDLRLFRNGLLVRLWPGDVLRGAKKQTIEATIPVVAGENRLTAYAFNRDNVKSTDARLPLTGADNLKRVGTAYLLAIGVGQYENSQYNLNYPVADAKGVSEQLRIQQEQLGHYSPIVVIPLLDEAATKANILLALRRLAGSDTGPLPANAPAALAAIKPAQPEDAVILYFSGHGDAAKDRFYLIPQDLGYLGARKNLHDEDLQKIHDHSISDLELAAALQPLDAEQLLLIIDACKSGQALESAEKRRGPMNTRGLAQLAYEKGMYVLTASQSDEVAFESRALGHSYLAYALVEEGLKSGKADLNHDGSILLGEWFEYATERVPLIRLEKIKVGKELEEVEPDEDKVQRPRVFYPSENGARQMVIERFANVKTR